MTPPDAFPELYHTLLAQDAPQATPASLHARLAEWERARDVALRTMEFIDLTEARHLLSTSRALLQAWERFGTAERALVAAAVLYFAEEEDASSDFELGGLTDDAEVMRWTCAQLGWTYPASEPPA